MRTPSRRMAQLPSRELGLLGTTLWLGALTLLFASPGLVWWPLALIVPAAAICMDSILRLRDRRIARERDGESICEFARGFDCRTIDTWIIRAVYEEFSQSFPLRPSDRLKGDLRIDGDDLDFGAIHIARRTGRSLDGYERNPMFGKINTLRDVVMFFHHQPLLSAPQVRQR